MVDYVEQLKLVEAWKSSFLKGYGLRVVKFNPDALLEHLPAKHHILEPVELEAGDQHARDQAVVEQAAAILASADDNHDADNRMEP